MLVYKTGNSLTSLDEVLYTGFYPRIFDKNLNPTEAMSLSLTRCRFCSGFDSRKRYDFASEKSKGLLANQPVFGCDGHHNDFAGAASAGEARIDGFAKARSHAAGNVISY